LHLKLPVAPVEARRFVLRHPGAAGASAFPVKGLEGPH